MTLDPLGKYIVLPGLQADPVGSKSPNNLSFTD